MKGKTIDNPGLPANGHGRRNLILTAIHGVAFGTLVPRAAGGTMTDAKIQAGEATSDQQALLKLIKDQTAPVKWVFVGDSITQGASHTGGYRSYPEIFSERMRFELNRSRDIIVNTAISGNAAIDIIHDLEWRVDQFHPDVVSLMIGTNDAADVREIPLNEFRRDLEKLVTHFRTIGAIPIVHTPNTIVADSPQGRSRERLPVFIDAVRDIARERQVILVDHWRYWEENKERAISEEWLSDPLHPNGKGHLEMARLLFRLLSICDSRSFTCGGSVKFCK